MILTIRQTQLLIEQLLKLNVNQQVQNIVTAVNYALRPFGGNINTGYPQGIKLYLQATKDIEK